MDAVTELALEPVSVEEPEKELEICFLAVVRRGREQEEVPGQR